MVDARAIGIAADHQASSVDSIERSKRRAREIIDHKFIRLRQEQDAVRRARRVAVAAHDQIHVVIAEKDCARRTHRIDRSANAAVAITDEPMS